jgi:hypothetical protein
MFTQVYKQKLNLLPPFFVIANNQKAIAACNGQLATKGF